MADQKPHKVTVCCDGKDDRNRKGFVLANNSVVVEESSSLPAHSYLSGGSVKSAAAERPPLRAEPSV